MSRNDLPSATVSIINNNAEISSKLNFQEYYPIYIYLLGTCLIYNILIEAALNLNQI